MFKGVTPPSQFPTKGTRSKWAQKRAEMLHPPCILGGPQTNGDKIRIGCLNPAFWGTHKWAEMPRQRCFLRDTQQRRQKQSTKKTKKTKTKNFPWHLCPFLWSHRLLPQRFEPKFVQLQGHCCTTRVQAISDTPVHKGGIHIWSNLVFIHYWVLLKKLSILSIDTWGENPFFHPVLIQANFASRAFGAHGPALYSQFPGRGGGRGGGVSVKGLVPASSPCKRVKGQRERINNKQRTDKNKAEHIKKAEEHRTDEQELITARKGSTSGQGREESSWYSSQADIMTWSASAAGISSMQGGQKHV